jgi:CRP-like cAMP-binding protein
VSEPIDWTAVNTARVEYESGSTVFLQGDPANTVMYIERGAVQLSVLSYSGKEAVIAILESGDFFGESCLAGQPKRVATATAMTPTAILVITGEEVIGQLHSSAFADRFLAHVLKRNLRTLGVRLRGERFEIDFAALDRTGQDQEREDLLSTEPDRAISRGTQSHDVRWLWEGVPSGTAVGLYTAYDRKAIQQLQPDLERQLLACEGIHERFEHGRKAWRLHASKPLGEGPKP